MPSLSTNLRNDLARAITNARRVAEAGARTSLEAMAVQRHEPHSSMSVQERTLRTHLRARGRQLGDVRDRVSGTQSIDRLAHEVAYEHWHRMLFARFLAENSLLIEPESGVAITMDECEELAREAGEDPRTLASRFAQDSLPQIFRSDDPVLEVTLAPETRQALDNLLGRLPSAVFTATDSLGWTYQYWQAEKKDTINESGNKIGADELPAVTQLFTEHYMVLFLYHNTIGAWHAGKVMAANPSLAETAQSEEELRRAVRLQSQGSYDFEYLRFVREPREGDEEDNPTGPWRPAAGAFEGWPRTAKELKVLDPCCGSGHFLIEGFELLVRLRMDEEGLNLEDATRNVLADNLHGLEIDPRCTQIAAFNLAMAAWKMVGKPIELPPMSIACSGLAVGSAKAEWIALAGEDTRLRFSMERLYDLFEQAPELGSLIDPMAVKAPLFEANFAELQPLLAQARARESDDVEDAERAVAAQGMARAAELLSGEYTLVITNVPYLGRGQQSDLLKEFADEYFEDSRADLATIFLERILRLLGGIGTSAAVTPQNWLFLPRSSRMREKLFKRRTWNLVARLGTRAFETISGEVVNVALQVITSSQPCEGAAISGVDASAGLRPTDKAAFLRGQSGGNTEGVHLVCAIQLVAQFDQLMNPDARLELTHKNSQSLLSAFADAIQGASMVDLERFRFLYWELDSSNADWVLHQSSPSGDAHFTGMKYLSANHDTRSDIHETARSLKDEGRLGGYRSGHKNKNKSGVLVAWVGRLPASRFIGSIYDHNTSAIIPRDAGDLPAIWSFCESASYNVKVREGNPKSQANTAALTSVPFDLEHWQKVADEKYPNSLPEPQSDDPTQWLFHGHPAKAEPATFLQVAVGRLLGYQWPPELDTKMRLADEAREWVARCDELKNFADQDGIVCLSATRGERSAADRLRELLSAAFGSDWSNARERELLAAASGGNRPADSLEIWLRDKFFEEHCKLFHHRPFVWHIWDGNRNGFHCLVNAHKLTGEDGEGRRILEAITYAYLGDWIDRQRADQQEGKEGSDARLAAAQNLQGQLRKILEGEPPYDLFVRWKPLHEQAIGWEPDINDGVRLNIRPFMNAELRTGGKKGAGILRWKPNIKWAKDRGKEPQSLRPRQDFPWFWGCADEGTLDERTDFTQAGDFDGNRWNDLHYTRGCKEAAHERSGMTAEA